ncbi:imidazole glycerol phosphate synthase subunit HisH [Candidatus Sororendozoicomonas aggregata]|uniref:imidazole glycerol phosphate synthase subunit HisH n=1 Tax=Candidatus Sororendozoicomonas aggregata TaxID=3073239 RepID=UPI002ECFF5FE
MSALIGIVDYGNSGNIKSIKKAIEYAGAKTVLIENPDKLSVADKIVLPGVGSFNNAMSTLRESYLIDHLAEAVEKKPTLGICLGMQILSKVGFEFGKTKGIGFFDAEVKPIQCSGFVPHMGFNKIEVQRDNLLLKGLNGNSFYFMHSFEVVNYKNVLALSEYCEHEFVSAMGKDEVYGVQFHPEKSKEPGIKLFENFIHLK